jgi:hypothetical protein
MEHWNYLSQVRLLLLLLIFKYMEPKCIDRMFEGMNYWNEILIKEYSFQTEDQQTMLYEKISKEVPQVRL